MKVRVKQLYLEAKITAGECKNIGLEDKCHTDAEGASLIQGSGERKQRRDKVTPLLSHSELTAPIDCANKPAPMCGSSIEAYNNGDERGVKKKNKDKGKNLP